MSHTRVCFLPGLSTMTPWSDLVSSGHIEWATPCECHTPSVEDLTFLSQWAGLSMSTRNFIGSDPNYAHPLRDDRWIQYLQQLQCMKWSAHLVLPNPRFRRPIGLLLTSSPRPAKPHRYFATFGLLLTSWLRNVLKSGAFVKNCQFPANSGGFWAFSMSMNRFIVNW